MTDIALYSLLFLVGFSVGVSATIGMYPVFEQPKNIRWQLAFFGLGVFALFIWCVIKFKLFH